MIFEKDPNVTSSFSIDWSAWLAGDTISASTFTELPSDLTLVSSSFTNTVATFVLSGGTPGRTYRIKNHITTATSLTEDQTVEVVIVDH